MYLSSGLLAVAWAVHAANWLCKAPWNFLLRQWTSAWNTSYKLSLLSASPDCFLIKDWKVWFHRHCCGFGGHLCRDRRFSCSPLSIIISNTGNHMYFQSSSSCPECCCTHVYIPPRPQPEWQEYCIMVSDLAWSAVFSFTAFCLWEVCWVLRSCVLGTDLF